MKIHRLCILCLTAFALTPLPALAQKLPNIAGTYRGLMTECLSVARSTDCRKGLTEVIRHADAVDTKRVEWERAAATGDGSLARTHDEYTQALAQLDRAVTAFNQDMNSQAVISKP